MYRSYESGVSTTQNICLGVMFWRVIVVTGIQRRFTKMALDNNIVSNNGTLKSGAGTPQNLRRDQVYSFGDS
jgi:hypothetical protein